MSVYLYSVHPSITRRYHPSVKMYLMFLSITLFMSRGTGLILYDDWKILFDVEYLLLQIMETWSIACNRVGTQTKKYSALLTSCMTFPDFERFVIFATASSPFIPGPTVTTEVAKWQTLPTVPLWWMSPWSRPIIVLTAPPNENTENNHWKEVILHLTAPLYI